MKVSHVPLLLSVKNGFRYLNIIKDDKSKGGNLLVETWWTVRNFVPLLSIQTSNSAKL